MLDYSALHRQYGQRKETGAVQATAPVAQSGPIDYDALHRKYGQRTETPTQRSLEYQLLRAQKAAQSPIFRQMEYNMLHPKAPKASEVILKQSDTVNQQIKEAKAAATWAPPATIPSSATAAGALPPAPSPSIPQSAAAYDAHRSEWESANKSEAQKEAEAKAATLKKLQDQQTELAKAYYVTENEEQRERILKDKPMWEKYLKIGDLQNVISMASNVAADAQNPGSGGEPYQIIQAKERLAREYGITDEALRNYALHGDDDSIPADGKYTNISQFIHQLEREEQKLSDELTKAGYNYQRMTEYQQRRKDHAESLVKADQRRRAAREDPGLAALGTTIAKPFQFMDYAGAALSGIGRSDPSDPKNYVPINTYRMDTTNAVNTVRGEQSKMAEEAWGPVGSFAYQTGMSMADFLFTAGVTGSFSGGGKAASNLALGIMGSSAAADTTVSALNRGLSNRQALTLGAIAGAAEILTEKVSLEKLLDMTSLSKSRLGYVLQNIVAEGSEEAASDVINWVADVLVSQDKSEWRQAIAAYQEQGKDENKAFWLALRDQAAAIGLDALGGALSGGIMAGGRVAIDSHYDRAAGRDFRQSMKSMDGLTGAPADRTAKLPRMTMEAFTDTQSPVWRNVDLDDETTKAQITRGVHQQMVDEGRVVTVPKETIEQVSQFYPDVRAKKRAEKNAILKPLMDTLKTSLRQFLNGMKGTSFEFEVNGNVLEATLYGTGIREVMEKVTQDKASMLYHSAEIFKGAQYLYSTPDYNGDPNIYRWNYFYTPVKIGDEVAGVRIAVRDMVRQTDGAMDSQIYNWGIKRDASLDGGERGSMPDRSGVSSDAPGSMPLGGEQPGVSASSPGASSGMTSINSIPQPPTGVNLRRSLSGGIPADIPPGLRKLYRLAQEMSTKPQPREIPHRPVQQSPQEILSQLAREITQNPDGPLGDMSNEDVRNILDEIGRRQSDSQDTASVTSGASTEIGTVDFADKASIMEQLALVQKETAELDHEVCYTVTADGKVWKVSGEAGRVDQSAIPSSLAGAYSFHNHPKSKTWHSFSAEDVRSFFRNGEQLAKAADYLYEYTMERTEDTVDIDPDMVYHKFKEIYNREIKKMAWYGEIDIDIDGFHETMRILSQELRFHYERKKTKTS